MDKEKLYIEINGPELAAMRYIYAVQQIDNGIQFGASRNKFGSNIIRITEENETFRIIYIKLTKPKYNHNTGEMTPHKKVVKHEVAGLSINELRELLNKSFK